MSEKYFNAFVDAAVGSIHEYVALTLQLKAQLRVANDLLNEKSDSSTEADAQIEAIRVEKDAQILSLQNDLEILKREKESRIASLVKDREEAISSIIKDRDDRIKTLQNELTALKVNKETSSTTLQTELNGWKERAKKAEDSYNAISNKVNHMDTLTKQYSDLKNQYVSLTKEYEAASARVKELEEAAQTKSPKKVINNKSSASKPAVIAKQKETTLDDF